MAKISISLSKKNLEKIDDYIERNGYTRSGFLISSALNVILDETQMPRGVATRATTTNPSSKFLKRFDKVIKTPKQAKAAIKEPQDNSYFHPLSPEIDSRS